jgi:hypothetical protein
VHIILVQAREKDCRQASFRTAAPVFLVNKLEVLLSSVDVRSDRSKCSSDLAVSGGASFIRTTFAPSAIFQSIDGTFCNTRQCLGIAFEKTLRQRRPDPRLLLVRLGLGFCIGWAAVATGLTALAPAVYPQLELSPPAPQAK